MDGEINPEEFYTIMTKKSECEAGT
jgi:hypothetical protein